MLHKKSRIIAHIVLTVFLICIMLLPAAAQAAPVLTTYTPTEISTVLNNPYMGWAPWANGGPYTQPHRLVYINATWSELEPAKGNYAFDSLEVKNKFSYWDSKGVKIILRINMDYPSTVSHKDIPDWLYNEINGDGTWYDIDWGKGFSPNYSNSKLIAYHKALIRAMGQRYSNDDRVAIIALGSVGHWGEWHTKKSTSFTIPFPPKSVTDQYIQPYIDAYPNKQMVIRRPIELAGNNNFGFFNDSMGDYNQTYPWFLDYINNGYTDWLTNTKIPAYPDFWKTSFSGGEYAAYPGLGYFQSSTIQSTLQQIRDAHTSWAGPCSPATQPAGTSLQANFDAALKTMGYRFVIQSLFYYNETAPGSTLSVTMNWANKGVAPFYYQWPVELSLADSAGNIVAKKTLQEDIRKWLPGTKPVTAGISIPSTLAAGKYTICAAILDPKTAKPGIELAISNKRADGRYSLGQVTVTNPNIPVVTSASIKGSTYIQIPTKGYTYSDYTAAITDQFSKTMAGESVQWTLQNPGTGITISNAKVIVDPKAAPCKLILKAVSSSKASVYTTKELIIIR